MDVAVAPTHRAKRRAEKSPRRVENRFVESQPPRHVANERCKNISLAQSNADRDAQRLLPASEKDAAENFPRAIKARELVIEYARQQHEAIRFDVKITRGRNVSGRCGFDHRLNHP